MLRVAVSISAAMLILGSISCDRHDALSSKKAGSIPIEDKPRSILDSIEPGSSLAHALSDARNAGFAVGEPYHPREGSEYLITLVRVGNDSSILRSLDYAVTGSESFDYDAKYLVIESDLSGQVIKSYFQ